ncbi:MAG: hypothetical protein Q7R85_04630 [bacterium]|nr:hypothetical protein [bacterium]
MRSKMLKALRDEIKAVVLGPKDEPTRDVGDNDTLILYGREVPVEMKKIFALWQRSDRECKELQPRWNAIVAFPPKSQEERNAAYEIQNRLILATRAEQLWKGMLERAIRHAKPELAVYAVELCRNWHLVLVGEEEER